ncbi:hypothetical protein BDK51DRAFT_52878 [Blyttiomyces helicus]|uniref:N-acetyltransferase domain-containing protein n=1 Tax=Blyttiomyces helicus TaxID=388810 RepID=A0A4V1IR29_9FUNG|nr:hypothetical protein BDK51DRAFT_52878 [Blyttiomyces helicus]|eukprot:RKO88617.1 hypothetical protein BDK51DRAFT_52878 [Blyttiomyces helicus]
MRPIGSRRIDLTHPSSSSTPCSKDRLYEIIDTLGTASAKAQGLRSPITSVSKLAQNPDHRMYILSRQTPRPGVVGMLKIGKKNLFVVVGGLRSGEGLAFVLERGASRRPRVGGRHVNAIRATLSPHAVFAVHPSAGRNRFPPPDIRQANNFVIFKEEVADKDCATARPEPHPDRRHPARTRSPLRPPFALRPLRTSPDTDPPRAATAAEPHQQPPPPPSPPRPALPAQRPPRQLPSLRAPPLAAAGLGDSSAPECVRGFRCLPRIDEREDGAERGRGYSARRMGDGGVGGRWARDFAEQPDSLAGGSYWCLQRHELHLWRIFVIGLRGCLGALFRSDWLTTLDHPTSGSDDLISLTASGSMDIGRLTSLSSFTSRASRRPTTGETYIDARQ